MADYRKLVVWQKARELVKNIYLLTRKFPQFETFGLSSQMQRAAVSVLSNIAEGCGRQSDKEFIHFLHISKGSLFEVESQLYIAGDLGYLTETEIVDAEVLCEEISKKLSRLIQAIEGRPSAGL